MQSVAPGSSSIENDAHGIEKLLLKTQVSLTSFLHSQVNQIIHFIFFDWRQAFVVRKRLKLRKEHYYYYDIIIIISIIIIIIVIIIIIGIITVIVIITLMVVSF